MLRIAGTIPESIVDGPGFRFALFTQGCPHHCPGCHNPQTHNPEGGRQVSLLALMRQIWQSRAHIDGVTFSGGDPFCQPLPLYHLARWCHRLGLDVMAYSGWNLTGKLAGFRECHIQPDWLLIYSKEDEGELHILNLVRTGTHSDLFKK